MKFLIVILYAILITVSIGFLAWVFNDTFEDTAVAFLIGVISAILAKVNTKEDE